MDMWHTFLSETYDDIGYLVGYTKSIQRMVINKLPLIEYMPSLDFLRVLPCLSSTTQFMITNATVFCGDKYAWWLVYGELGTR